jgi:hypothetical protein
VIGTRHQVKLSRDSICSEHQIGPDRCRSAANCVTRRPKLHRLRHSTIMNTTRLFAPGARRAISTALRPCSRHQHLPHPQKTFVRGATVVPGLFPIHKLPLLTFLRHQSVAPKNAEIEDARPQIKPRYQIHYTCGVYVLS